MKGLDQAHPVLPSGLLRWRVYLSLTAVTCSLVDCFTLASPAQRPSDTGHTIGQPRKLLILAYARKAITISVLARRNNTLTVALSTPEKNPISIV